MNITLRITGTTPLLMHNARLSDPLDPYTRELAVATSAKKGKGNWTEDREMEVARLEWTGGLYYDPELGPYMPGTNLARSLAQAARITREGKNIERGLVILDVACPLDYDGPRDLDGLWKQEEFRSRMPVKVGMQQVVRTRPRFHQWSFTADALLDTEILEFEALRRIADAAGRLAGLGDYRPSAPHGGPYGRYEARVSTI